jgi:hypothetical protein
VPAAGLARSRAREDDPKERRRTGPCPSLPGARGRSAMPLVPQRSSPRPRALEHSSTRALEHSSTRALEHSSTRALEDDLPENADASGPASRRSGHPRRFLIAGPRTRCLRKRARPSIHRPPSVARVGRTGSGLRPGVHGAREGPLVRAPACGSERERLSGFVFVQHAQRWSRARADDPGTTVQIYWRHALLPGARGRSLLAVLSARARPTRPPRTTHPAPARRAARYPRRHQERLTPPSTGVLSAVARSIRGTEDSTPTASRTLAQSR